MQLRRIFELYIFGNIHVAIAVWALTKLTLFQISISDSYTPAFVFFSTLLSYNFIRLYRFKTTENWFGKWLEINKMLLIIFSIMGFIGATYTLFQIQLKALLMLLPFGFLTMFYSVPLFNKSLRTVPFIKIFMIAISWAGTTVLFPVLNNDIALTAAVLHLFIQRFLFTLIITIPFDIRDLSYDNTALQTIPQILGVQNSKYIGMFMILWFLYFSQNSSYQINLILAVLLFLSLLFASKNQQKYYAAFFIESIPIIWYLLSINCPCIH